MTGLDDPSGVTKSPPGENRGHGRSGDTRVGHGIAVPVDALCHAGGGTVLVHMPSSGETNFQREALPKRKRKSGNCSRIYVDLREQLCLVFYFSKL